MAKYFLKYQNKKDLFQIYACTNWIYSLLSQRMSIFWFIAQKSIGINYFPIGYRPPFTKILYKNLKSINSNKKVNFNNKIKWKYNFKI